MDMDWREIGEGVALVLAGAGAAFGVIRKWFNGSKEAPSTAAKISPMESTLLPAVLEALQSGKEAADDAVAALRAVSLSSIEQERSIASLIGALRGIVDRLEVAEGRLRKLAARLERSADRTAEHKVPPPSS